MSFKVKIRKFIFWIAAALSLISLLSLAYLFKKITPLYEFDESKKQVMFLGGNYKFDFKKDIYFKVKDKLHENNLKVFLDGDIAIKDFKVIHIEAEKTDMVIDSYGKKFSYRCRASRQKSEIIEKKGDELRFKIDGEAICQVAVPDNKKVKIIYHSGLLRIHSLDQDIDVKIKDGMLIWGSYNYSKFKLNLEMDNGQIYGNKDRFNNSKAKLLATLHVKNSIIFFR